jgi:hypothetical protein
MKSAKIMFMYAAYIVVFAGTAFVMAADKSKATTAVYAGGGAALLMLLCGWMANQIETRRTIGMIGIHVGLVLPLVYAIEFARRAYSNFAGADGKTYLAVIFTALAVGSVVAFIAILRTRPKRSERTV